MIGLRKKKKEVKAEKAAALEWRVSSALVNRPAIGRRNVQFGPYKHLIIPSFSLDYSEFLLREYGKKGKERFLIFAGTLKQDDAFVSTVVVPPNGSGLVDANTVSLINDHLDGRDLIPLAQIHTHPFAAFLSPIDAQMPFFASAGFLSIIIPRFAFGSLRDLSQWKVYRYFAPSKWSELTSYEIESTIIIDDAAITI